MDNLKIRQNLYKIVRELLEEVAKNGLQGDDYFVLQFLEAEDPVDFLMEEATWYAKREENFYLYRVYKDSYRYYDFFS